LNTASIFIGPANFSRVFTAAMQRRVLKPIINHKPIPSTQSNNMSAEIIDNTGGIVTAKITGKLTHPELVALQKSATDILRQRGKARLLVVAENFQGWEKGGDWGDLSFQMENDTHIEKMAIVGEKKWEDLALVFAAKGLRKFPIEYFQPADLAKARAWLTAE
jgi:hypothetical protein